MEHLLLKAATTATTDQGEFTALAATYSVDRVKDRIVPGAFKTTIERWQASGKQIPLHWNHEGDAKSIIGSIDPSKTKETDQGLYVEGKLDLADSEIAREAWRSMKNGSMSLSFGYIVDQARKAKDGIQELLAIDLFEVSIVPAPANADTRVLSFKAMNPQAMAERMRSMADEMASDSPPTSAEMAQRMRDMAEQMDAMKALTELTSVDEPGNEGPREARSVDSLRDSAQKVALEVRSGGLSAKPPRIKQVVEAPKPEPEMTPDELRKHSRDLMIQVLSGETT